VGARGVEGGRRLAQPQFWKALRASLHFDPASIQPRTGLISVITYLTHSHQFGYAVPSLSYTSQVAGPRVEVLYSSDGWDSFKEGIDLEFRLLYQGKLSSAGPGDTRRAEKHAMRREFHRQLKELWAQEPILRSRPRRIVTPGGPNPPYLEWLADNYARHGFRFAPLIEPKNGMACALDILFLRRDQPGNLVKRGGDIDNRIKVLFDALRMPLDKQEVDGLVPGEGEDPFFCLLSDDSLIIDIRVTTDMLLLPAEQISHSESDVFLVIRVKTRMVDPVRAMESFTTPFL
jgi:hypothetical protein